MSSSWTSVDDLIAKLRARWDRGQYLRAHASSASWEPVSLPVKAPTAAEMLHRLDEALRWAERFHRDSHTAGGQPRFTVLHRTVRSRALGDNDVPARITVETFEQLCTLLRTTEQVRALDTILDATRRTVAELEPWVAQNPVLAIEHRDNWDDLLATVRWIVDHDTTSLDIRHLDVPGVDTKFVERHSRLLGRLLVAVLPPQRINPAVSRFADRFGFLPRPSYTWLRLLCPLPTFPAAFTELVVRTGELAEVELPVRTVFVVENKASYLSFPDIADAVVIFGEGFNATSLDALPWLVRKELVYWGDIDTHGFAILSRLRERMPSVRSMLMDHDTLLAHPDQLVIEDNPTSAPLAHLTASEQALYRDLVEERFGPAVRLEQERVRFSLLRRALEPWSDASHR